MNSSKLKNIIDAINNIPEDQLKDNFVSTLEHTIKTIISMSKIQSSLQRNPGMLLFLFLMGNN